MASIRVSKCLEPLVVIASGNSAVFLSLKRVTFLIFLVQIQNMEYFKIAKDIDNEYYKNYLIAKKAGVNFLAYRCKISSKEILIEKKLEIKND